MLKTDYDIPIFKDEDVADLNEYSNEMASALKTQLDKFGNPLVYKGEVATLEDLPSEAESGNIYSVTSENKNYIYNGTIWVEYSSTLDLTYLENNTKEVSEELKEVTENKRLTLEGKSEQTGEPTVANPVKIRNVGDNINLFDKSNDIITNKGLISNGKTFDSSVSSVHQYIKIKPNSTYVYSGYTDTSYTKRVCIYSDKLESAFISQKETTNNSLIFTTPSSAKYIRIQFKATELNNIKLEEGSTATPYTEYGCGSIDYEINTTQNIFNKDTDIELDGQYRNYGNGNISTNQNYYGVKVKVEKNREYKVFSYQDYSNLCYFDKDMNYLSGELFGKNTKATIFNTSSNCEYITLAVAKSGINEFSITEAKIIHFPLSKGQLLHEGDYLAKDGIHQKKKTLVLTGNETWNLGKNANSLTYFFTNAGFVSAKNQNILCNSLTPITNLWNEAENKDLICIRSKLDLLNIMLSDTTINTVESFKAWLVSKYNNGTPVTVEYELAEEIVTPLTNKQTEEFYELQKAKYVDEMTLTCMNEVVPTLADIDKKLKENLLEIEENITKVEKKLKKEKSESGVIVSATEPREDNRRKIWLQKGRRLFNYKTANYLLAYSNITAMQITISLSSDNHRSSYVKCKPNTTYTIEKKAGHSFRVSTTTDEPAAGVTINKSVANHEGSTINITTGENDNYIFFTCFSSVNGDTGDYLDMYKTVKVEEGKSITPNKIYILNDDNEYEEFVTD